MKQLFESFSFLRQSLRLVLCKSFSFLFLFLFIVVNNFFFISVSVCCYSVVYLMQHQWHVKANHPPFCFPKPSLLRYLNILIFFEIDILGTMLFLTIQESRIALRSALLLATQEIQIKYQRQHTNFFSYCVEEPR